jgi:hypothetical protein
VNADEARQHVNHVPRTNAAGDLDSEALARPLVDDRQTLELLPIGAAIEDEVVSPDVIGRPRWRGRGRPLAIRRRGRLRGTCSPA